MPLRNANNNMKSLLMGDGGEGEGGRRASVTLKWWLSPCSGENSRPSSIGAFTACRIMRFCCVPQAASHKSLGRSRLETPDRAPGAAGGTVAPWLRGIRGMVAVSARPLGAGGGWGGAGRESQTVAAALRIDWIGGRIEAEQQKWVSLQAPADAGPDPPARGRLAGRRGGGCPAGLAERLEKKT